LVNWYISIWRGEREPLGRIPKPAERFEAAETLLAYGWGRPPQYVDLALASTEVRRIEVTFNTAPVEGNGGASSMVVDATPASHDGEGDGREPSICRDGRKETFSPAGTLIGHYERVLPMLVEPAR
jgi:hypothetical protein